MAKVVTLTSPDLEASRMEFSRNSVGTGVCTTTFTPQDAGGIQYPQVQISALFTALVSLGILTNQERLDLITLLTKIRTGLRVQVGLD